MKKRTAALSNDESFWKRARDSKYNMYLLLAELVFLGFSSDISLFKVEVAHSEKMAKFFFHNEILKRINKLLKFHREIKENRKIISPKGFKVKRGYVEVVGESGLSHLSLVIKVVIKDMRCEAMTTREMEEVKKIKKVVRDIFPFSSRYSIFAKTDKSTGNYIAHIIFEKKDNAMGKFPAFLEVSGKDTEEIKQKLTALKKHCSK